MDGPVIFGEMDRLLRDIVRRAVDSRASDIHIEPFEGKTLIRFRIDGHLMEHRTLEPEIHPALLLRLKILSGMAVDRSQLPQDGKWTWEEGADVRDIRVSLIPFLRGEGAVLRILMGFATLPNLLTLGFDAGTAAALGATVRGPDGLLLLAGPTGCGKSTTIHCLLQGVNDGTRKIIAVEDPVEYTADGIQSVPVNVARGLGFADALRAVLRQSPDVLFIGEIRDEETAAIAIQASLTGHFVCSTLHCRDFSGAIARLRQLNIPLHLIATTLRGILSQRLARKLCNHCKLPRVTPHPMAHRFSIPENVQSFCAIGCNRCMGQGYFGQTVIYEWLSLQEPVQPENFMATLRSKVAVTFAHCARKKISVGEISPEEAYLAGEGITSF
ncbi:MAG: GspE/PulE family protein [Puniceicoccales bacterium]|jgi:type II secretory ATPase GspE/PulE/Tfp pilus assembly ATPase PilB-like protein|nr:GspE/PulE family protein [Puniceicoccales bacterium]